MPEPVTPYAGKPKCPKDQQVVAGEIHEIGANQREGDGTHHVHALKRSANREIEQQWNQSGRKRPHIRRRQDRDRVRDSEALKVLGNDPNRNRQKRSYGKTQVDPIYQRSMAVLSAARAERLGNERVKPDQQPLSEEREHDKQAGSDAHGTDGFGGVGQPADHHRIYDDHAHPPNLGQNQRKSQAQGRAKLGAKDGEEGHGGFRKIAERTPASPRAGMPLAAAWNRDRGHPVGTVIR